MIGDGFKDDWKFLLYDNFMVFKTFRFLIGIILDLLKLSLIFLLFVVVTIIVFWVIFFDKIIFFKFFVRIFGF